MGVLSRNSLSCARVSADTCFLNSNAKWSLLLKPSKETIVNTSNTIQLACGKARSLLAIRLELAWIKLLSLKSKRPAPARLSSSAAPPIAVKVQVRKESKTRSISSIVSLLANLAGSGCIRKSESFIHLKMWARIQFLSPQSVLKTSLKYQWQSCHSWACLTAKVSSGNHAILSSCQTKRTSETIIDWRAWRLIEISLKNTLLIWSACAKSKTV